MSHSNGHSLISMAYAGNFFIGPAVELMLIRLVRFLREELSWNATKVDELLLPIIQKMGKRGQVRHES